MINGWPFAPICICAPLYLQSISAWKKYMETLSEKPITTYTSAEIALHLKNEQLKRNLQNIDVAIYSGRVNTIKSDDFNSLRNIAIDLYSSKMNPQNKK